MKKFLVFIERKANFTGNSIEAHRAFLKDLNESAILAQFGGFPDQTGGAYVIQAASLEEAAAIVHKDPMYIEDLCLYKVKEWNVQ